MIPPTTLQIIALSALFGVVASQGCDEYCSDFHRFCPGVKDPNFRQQYISEIFTLAPLSHKILPPETVDCKAGFYKYTCPKSCGLCVPCKPDLTAEKEVLKQEIIAELETFLRGKACDPCTQIEVGKGSDGRPLCAEKYQVDVVQEGQCSCWCGQGSKTTEKDCVTYFIALDGTCQELRSKDSARCGGEQLSITEKCIERTCEIDKIFELSSTNVWAFTNKEMTYKAFTDDNQICDLGVVGGPIRDVGQSYTYDVNHLCNICMKSATEVFDHLDLRIAGNDAWISDHIEITVNGNVQKYYPMIYPDGVYLSRGNTYSFVKTRGVTAP